MYLIEEHLRNFLRSNLRPPTKRHLPSFPPPPLTLALSHFSCPPQMATGVGKQGYVFKEGAKVLNWKKRYLVVERDKLTYYTKDNLKERKGEILLRTVKEVKPWADYKGRKYVFGIVTTTGRTYFVQGSDDDNVKGWVESINTAIGKPATASPASPTPGQPPVRPVLTTQPTQTQPQPQQARPVAAKQPEPEVAQVRSWFPPVELMGGWVGTLLLDPWH